MAKDLSTFLGHIGPKGIKEQVGVHTWDFTYTGIGRGGRGGVQNCCFAMHTGTYCVPFGTTCLKFEIWGAGGVPTGLTNCGFSVPSGAGAYAYKVLTDPTPGDCYFVYAGRAWYGCCFPTNGGTNLVPGAECWDATRHTYVQGNGLTNFCAESGRGGQGICCIALNCHTACWKIGNDSDGKPEAQYYGADGGATGMNGYVQGGYDSSGWTGHPANYRQWVPFPGGIFNSEGGHIPLMTCGDNTNLGQSGNAEWWMRQMSMNVNSNSLSTRDTKFWGWGFPGSFTCGGATNCAPAANGGRIRITAWYPNYHCSFASQDG